MEIFSSIFLGAVQGLTEFLPVSSSGHLVIFRDILQLKIADSLSFDVILHLGTLAALLYFFHKDIISYLKAFLNSLAKWDLKNNLDQKIAWLILISTFPAALVGFFLEDIIENIFRQPFLVALVLFAFSFTFFIAEWYSKQNKDFSSLTWKKSLVLGFAQALALIPGVSRSGITIATGMFYNLKREIAARFSFLMAIPVVAGAGAKKIIDLGKTGMADDERWFYVFGFFASAIVGYFCIKYFLAFLKKYSLNWFAAYRIVLSLVILIYIFVKQ